MATVEFDMSEFKEFFQRLDRAAKGDFRAGMELWLEALGEDFLRVVQDEIVRREVMNSRILLSSFEKSGDGSVWEMLDGGLTLEVGTSVEYANWVENGHRQQPGRFIPGYWEAKNGKDVFVYDPSADSGMILKQRWVNGKHYFDGALRAFKPIFKASAEIKLREWFDNYFGS